MSDKNDLAEDRTDWAEDRTILANERTFAGWMRTGMACVGLALGLKAVIGDFEPTWAAKAAASVFIFLALFIFWSARHKACTTMARMNEHATEPQSIRNVTVTATTLSVGAVATGMLLWFL